MRDMESRICVKHGIPMWPMYYPKFHWVCPLCEIENLQRLDNEER